MCTFHVTIEMYRALHVADDFGTSVLDSRGHSPITGLVRPALQHTIGAVVGVCRGKDKPYFHNASLIDSDSNQVSCRFPDLYRSLYILFWKSLLLLLDHF